MVAWHERRMPDPFRRSSAPRPPAELRDADGMLSAAAEVKWLNELAGDPDTSQEDAAVESGQSQGEVKDDEPPVVKSDEPSPSSRLEPRTTNPSEG